MKHYKVETYVPQEALDKVKNELYKIGLGKVGNYDCCLSWYKIDSSWRPLDGANPYLGIIGKVEYATEYKIEFRCDENDIEKIIETIKQSHPYEEVCINVIPLLM